MPTNIGAYRNAEARFFAKKGKASDARRMRRRVRNSTVFSGWVPDMPPDKAGFGGARVCRNLVQLATRQRGLWLGQSMGYTQDTSTALGAGGARAIILGSQYQDVDKTIERVVVAAGDGGANNMTPYRDVAGTWTALTLNAGGAATAAPTRESLLDSTVFPFGAPTRNGSATPIAEPMFIWCGGDLNSATCPVYCTPDGAASPGNQGNYDELDRFSALSPFKARSVESFDGRVYFFGTEEAGTEHLNRLRWTAPATADPDPANRGAGGRDFHIFQQPGQRVLAMRDRLVLYFGDGVAFAKPKRLLTDPLQFSELSRTRGLLATNAVTAISPLLHFGVFNDGWWLLNAAGGWKQAGLARFEESRGKDIEVTKWRETWYEDLDIENRNRISCEYEPFRDQVYISYPSRTHQAQRTIIYDVPTDTAWPQDYGPTVFFKQDTVLRDGKTYAQLEADGTTYAELEAAGTTYADLMPRFGFEGLLHGTEGGHIMSHDPGLTARDGAEPTYSWEPHEQRAPDGLTDVWTFHELGMDYLNVGGPAITLEALTDGGNRSQAHTLSLDEPTDTALEQHTVKANFRLRGSHLTYRASGTAPALIRSFAPEMWVYGSRDMAGQTG